MRKTIANILRRVADWLDPKPPAVVGEQVIPIEWIPTEDLALEIRRRNDLCLLWYGRDYSTTPDWHDINGRCVWRMNRSMVVPVVELVMEELTEHFDGKAGT